MAEIMQQTRGKKGRNRPVIDLTPMVDLGFLLITFFIFTTTMLQVNTMEIVMPDNAPTPHPTVLPHHTAMTIYLAGNHKVYYFSGEDAMNNNFSALQETNFTEKHGIREILLTHIALVKQAYQQHMAGSKLSDQPFVLIKATAASTFGDVVNMIDELTITGIQGYAIVDMQAEENKQFASL